eukprot:CAMPEP_0194126534 /NCGR_PEP_ID=MMETSP0150-20130528/60041_1 /TAXON_ID=122233 /ORGANISM="Chaetoceros debilis, Strain MM31A-1" /LENGTH=405 /DNA_ID=CAMNT_0038820401 /DNA_START=48 /DNA_END=1265 /DNA_ORIENTATION=-
MSFQTFEFSSNSPESNDGDIILEGITLLHEGDDSASMSARNINSTSTSTSTWSFKKNYYSTEKNPILAVFALFHYTFRHHRLGFILSIILVGAVYRTYQYENWNWRAEYEKYEKKHSSWDIDYTSIHSSLELQLSEINHWCLDGGDANCHKCHDPTLPYARLDTEKWREAHVLNINKSTNIPSDVDVIFMGDGNTEARSGTYMGSIGRANSHLSKVLAGSKENFNSFFQKKHGGIYNGLALGIDGDTSPNLLWRIQNNEFAGLHPNVWWITIGSDDLFSTKCSEEVTVIGILRAIYELMSLQSGSMIVINSLLPTAVNRDLSLEGKGIINEYWYSIKTVNEQLQKFAVRHEGVYFFGATEFLTTRHKNGNLYMKKELFMDKFHLSAEGQGVLSEAQARMLTNILA